LEAKDIISSGILELYVLGIASHEEVNQVEQWLLSYPEVKEELFHIENAIEEYAKANAVEPPAALKERIVGKIEFAKNANTETNLSSNVLKPVVNNIADQKIYAISTFFKWAAAACFVLLLGSLALNYSYFNKYKSAKSDLQVAQVDLRTAQTDLDKTKEVASAMSHDMDVVTDKNARPVVLNGTPHAPDALAKIFWMKDSGEVYVDPSNLPAPALGKQYQLWAIVDGKPVDAGIISLQKEIYKIQKMKSFGSAQAFAITLEKAGGSPTPTMDEMYVMAKVI
jgi:anti-sigma-K factor RskA